MGRLPANLNRYFGRAAALREPMIPNSGNAAPAASKRRRVTALGFDFARAMSTMSLQRSSFLQESDRDPWHGRHQDQPDRERQHVADDGTNTFVRIGAADRAGGVVADAEWR